MAVARHFSKTKEDFVFSNVVYDNSELMDSVITREHDFELSFKCNYSTVDEATHELYLKLRSSLRETPTTILRYMYTRLIYNEIEFQTSEFK